MASNPNPFSDNFKWAVTALVIPVTTGVYGYFQERQKAAEAEQKERAAAVERDAREATAQKTALVQALLPDLLAADDTRRNMTLLVIKELDAGGQIPPNLRAVAVAYVKASEQRTRAGRGTEADAEVSEISAPPKVLAGIAVAAGPPPAAASGPPATGAAPPPVATGSTGAASPLAYIQVYSEAQRAALKPLQQSLRAMGIGAPGIENVAATAAARNARPPVVNGDRAAVLYFHPEDAPLAQRLADEARDKAGLTALDVKLVARYADKVPRGQLELWVPAPPAPKP